MSLQTTLAGAGLLTCLALPAAVLAQAELRKEVISAGGGATTSVSHNMRFTIGQPSVGVLSDSVYGMSIGFWTGGLGILSPVSNDFPIVFSMEQNYPNPFNPMTVISFSIPEPLSVRLSIYNVRGERQRLLVDGIREAGRHQVSWDGTDDQGRGVSSGTYIARIESAAGVQNRKMVLAR